MNADAPAGIAIALASLCVYLWALATHPTHMRCPPGWWLPEGARGRVARCRPSPVGVDTRDARGVLVDRTVQPPGEIDVPLYCTGGATLRQDGVKAWCQR
jgi:hypothetical protein